MSFWKICNFIQKYAAENEDIQNAMEKLCVEIERDENLRQEEQESFREMFQLQVELESLSSVTEQLQNEREQRKSIEEALTLAQQSSEELGEQLSRIDFQKLAGFEVLFNDRQRQQKWKEMEAESHQRQEMYNRMENRHIVQTLRRKQAELRAAEKEFEETKKKNKQILADGLSKLRATQLKRNEIILDLVKDHKEREDIKEKIKIILNQRQEERQELEQLKAKKAELQAKLQAKLQKQQKSSNPCETSQAIEKEAVFMQPPPVKTQNTNSGDQLASNTSIKNSFDPTDIDPMSFLTTIDINFDISAAMEIFYSNMQAENQEEAATKLRPILRTSNKQYDDKEQLQQENNSLDISESIEKRHVSFMESESYKNSMQTDGKDNDNDKNVVDDVNKQEKQEQQPIAHDSSNAENVEVIDLLTPSGAASATMLNATELSSEDSDIEMYEKRVQIIECKVVKPAGTALPKVLSTNLTTSPIAVEVIHETEIPTGQEIQAPPEQSNQTPIPTISDAKYSIKSPMNVADNNLCTTATIEAFINENSIQEQPIKASTSAKQAPMPPQSSPSHKRQSGIDFDSLFIPNASSDTEENENGILNNLLMFDFGGSTDRMNNDDVENDELIDFSDNDGATNTNIFF